MTRFDLTTRSLRSRLVISSTGAAVVLGMACIALTWRSTTAADASLLADSDLQSIWGDGGYLCAYLDSTCCIGRMLDGPGTCYLCDKSAPYVFCCNCCPTDVPNPCTYLNCGACGSDCVGADSYQTPTCGLDLGPCNTCLFSQSEGEADGTCELTYYAKYNQLSTTCKQ
jgi:hypothetical protein